MDDIHQIFPEAETGDVLATIVHVEGSAYKKEGAMMLFKQNGSQVGMISAGCLEEDVAERIKRNESKDAEIIVYDMRGYRDLMWGEGSGCNGLIQVLLEPITDVLSSQLTKLKVLLEQGKKVTMYKKLPIGNSEVKTLYRAGEEYFGDNDYFSGKSLEMTSQKFGKTKEGEKEVYFHCFQPKERLIVLGAGKDAIPLVDMASKTGFSVIVADWRPALCTKEHFPDADERIVGFPTDLVNKIQFSPNDFVVLLTHSFQKDKELLSYLIGKELKYLAVLGSKQRTKRLLGTDVLPPLITTPAGLSIDAEGADEIAISIIAQLIQVSKKSKVVLHESG
ncbi:XdhC family protein [Halobacillus salinarum]|uniref:XdhC family protein n=1 Tax=Halobacillus salinarum TaxID=2932257 RepID=A0ABY4EGV8_9BACI|nr:XdhC/CoxI family protein [Halobacillus salinarum]UOQ43703.1 XdhC family protein [Halobacillus salinarum]